MLKFNLSSVPKCAKPDTPGIVAKAEGGELRIMDYVGEDESSLANVRDYLAERKGQEVQVKINTFGGDAYTGLATYNAFLEHGNVVGTIEGIAFSAGAILAMGCKTLKMQKASDFGIHRALTLAYGNSKDMKGVIEWLENIDSHQVEIFAAKTGETPEMVEKWLDGVSDGTVWTASKAIELGFCDEIVEGETARKSNVENFKRQFHQQQMAARIRTLS